ncbi:MAG: hypothetical protein ACI8O8_000762 [Oleiphilaceae bacterium]|jgi:hypothetical protein
MVLSSHKPSNLRLISAIALAIAFVIALSVLWLLHEAPLCCLDSSLNSFDRHQWQQPSAISDRFPERISTKYWQFDYEATEQALLKIKQNEHGGLILNASTAKVLEKAISTLPIQMRQDEIQRVELLVIKGFPGRAGPQLANFFTDFYYYQQALNSANSIVDTREHIDGQELSFKQMVLLQKEYLGEDISEQLFGRQNRINHYLYARKAINKDSSLNSAQKQQQLSILQDRFKAHEE